MPNDDGELVNSVCNHRPLVTDAGSLLSHPAIIAHEFGIPAVLAIGNATTKVRDGLLVTVDGSTGTVEIVE